MESRFESQSIFLYQVMRYACFNAIPYSLLRHVEVHAMDQYKIPILYHLVRFDRFAWVRFFLEKGANPNQATPYDVTLLAKAIDRDRSYEPRENIAYREANRIKIIRLLIANGADLTISDIHNKRPIDRAGKLECIVIKEQLFQNAIYSQLMKPFQTEYRSHGVIWALLFPTMRLWLKLLIKNNGQLLKKNDTPKADKSVVVANKEKAHYMPTELLVRVFAWVLTDQLVHKPALLHLLPYSQRHVEYVESAIYYWLGQSHTLQPIHHEAIEADAKAQLDFEWKMLTN